MGLRVIVLAMLLVGCAGASSSVKPAAPDVDARVYDFSEEKTQQLVREILAARGIALLPTQDPHVLASLPKRTLTRHRTLIPTNLGLNSVMTVGEETLYTHERTWAVSFQPLGPSATAVRVVRGEQLTFGNAAERNVNSPFPDAPVSIEARAPLNFVRDREEEAAVAAELDGQVSVEVSEGAAGPVTPVPPLEDPKPVVASPASSPACSIEASQLEGLLGPGHVLLLSDPIGAQEPWAVLDRVRCLSASRALPVTFALSIPSREQAAFNTYLRSDGSPASQRALLATSFWNRSWQDGRSALAVFEFIETVRLRRAEGQPVTLLAVDSELAGNPRNAHIASRLLRHRAENPSRLIVAMLGNAATSRRVGTEWDQGLLPVGARLAAVLPEQTHAFDVAFWPGTHWTCHLEQHGKLRCGTWRITPGPKQASAALTPRPYFRTFGKTSPQGFDGVYFVGPLTASAPALASLRADEGTPVQLR
jgi:hypothetical protein